VFIFVYPVLFSIPPVLNLHTIYIDSSVLKIINENTCIILYLSVMELKKYSKSLVHI